MAVPALEFDDPDHGLPRQAVPLRLAYLISGLPFETFAHWFLRGNLLVGGEPLPIFEYGGNRIRTVRPEGYVETLPSKTGAARLDAELIAKLPKNHFVMSDTFVRALEIAASVAAQKRLQLTGLDWNPALYGMDALIEECYDHLGTLEAPPESGGELSKRDLGKQRTAARNARLFQAYEKYKRQHPDKSDPWIVERMSKHPDGEGLNPATIRRIIGDMK